MHNEVAIVSDIAWLGGNQCTYCFKIINGVTCTYTGVMKHRLDNTSIAEMCASYMALQTAISGGLPVGTKITIYTDQITALASTNVQIQQFRFWIDEWRTKDNMDITLRSVQLASKGIKQHYQECHRRATICRKFLWGKHKNKSRQENVNIMFQVTGWHKPESMWYNQ